MFLSLRMHARHWSSPLGRCFFHCGCMPCTGAVRWGDISFRTRPRRPTEPPILTRRTRDQQTGGTGVMGTEGHGRGARGRRRGLAKQQANAPSNISNLAPLVWRAPEGPEGTGAVPEGSGRAWPGFETTRPATHEQRSATGVEGLAAAAVGSVGAWPGTPAPQAPPVWRAWLRRPWAAAGPGRASGRRAERSSRRGRLAGGPPPTGAPSSPAQKTHAAPGTPAALRATPPEHAQKDTPTAPGTP